MRALSTAAGLVVIALPALMWAQGGDASRAAAIHLMPWAELFIVYLVMALVLAFRPEGLFQRTSARKI